jgi:hypothetical protein
MYLELGRNQHDHGVAEQPKDLNCSRINGTSMEGKGVQKVWKENKIHLAEEKGGKCKQAATQQ